MGSGPSRRGDGGLPAFFEELTESLSEFAIKKFELSKVVQGASLSDHLAQVEESTGETPEELELPEVTTYELHLWNKYVSLQRGRGCGINGAEPLSYTEMEAWTRLTGQNLEYWEVELMQRIDAEFIKFSRESN